MGEKTGINTNSEIVNEFCRTHSHCDECPAFMPAGSLKDACYFRKHAKYGNSNFDPRTVDLIIERMEERMGWEKEREYVPK